MPHVDPHLREPPPEVVCQLGTQPPLVGVVLIGVRGVRDAWRDRTHELTHAVGDSDERFAEILLAVIGMGGQIGDDHGDRRQISVVAEHHITVPL